jgi:hypothetical protein
MMISTVFSPDHWQYWLSYLDTVFQLMDSGYTAPDKGERSVPFLYRCVEKGKFIVKFTNEISYALASSRENSL